MLPKYNNTSSCSGSRIRRIWTPHFVESKLGLAEYEIDLTEDGEIDIFDAIQELSDYVDIDNIVKRYNNGEIDVLEKVQGFYGDITEVPKTYAEALQRIADSEKVFMSLPVDVRAKFGHSFSEFLAASNDVDFLERLGVQVDNTLTPEPVPEVSNPVAEKEVVKE